MLNTSNFTFGRIKGGFDIKRVPNTDFISISFISGNPDLSALAVNAYCAEFLRYYTSTKKESSGESVTFFKELVARKSEELQNKSEALINLVEINILHEFTNERNDTLIIFKDHIEIEILK